MSRVIDFNYNAVIEMGDELRVVGYNSPYTEAQDSQAIEDIKYALKDKELEQGKHNINIKCRFVENDDGTFNQIFNICEKEETKK